MIKALAALTFVLPLTAHADSLGERLTREIGCGRERALDVYLQSDLDQTLWSQGRPAASKLTRVVEDFDSHLRLRVENLRHLHPDENDVLLHLSRLASDSRIEPEYALVNGELDRILEGAKAFACEEPASAPKGSGDLLRGARWTMATAYQGCDVLDLPPVTNAVEEVKGVTRSIPIDSVGWGRSYTDLAELKRTHYYMRDRRFEGACLDQNRQPLVYDYGGVPIVDRYAGLQLFKNKGGGPALGIDCSAYISAAASQAGALFKAGSGSSPSYRRFVSRDFIDPKKSGWSCYDSLTIKRNEWIASGDIGSVKGHVVMVDRVGSDPFGLAKITTKEECATLPTNEFDFTVIQSSSDKEHLGINRYEAKDFLEGEWEMTELFREYGKAACLAKFDGKARKISSKEYRLIRHVNSSRCTGAAMKLAHEECISSCFH